MNYAYLNVRFDESYSLDVEAVSIVSCLQSIPQLYQTDKARFESQGPYPWGVISLVKCDPQGNFQLSKGQYFDRVNLIEIVLLETAKARKQFEKIGMRLAKELGWECVDDALDEAIGVRQ